MTYNALLFFLTIISLIQPLFGQDQAIKKPAIYKEGGMEAFYSFIKDNIVYPDSSISNCKQGKIYVRFVVNREGRVNGVCSINSIDGYLDAEAERIVALTTRNWKPGIIDGEIAEQKIVVPITFELPRSCHDKFLIVRELGHRYFKDRKYKKCIIEYKKALEFKPTDQKIVKNLGMAYIKKRNPEEACYLWSTHQFLGTEILDLLSEYCKD